MRRLLRYLKGFKKEVILGPFFKLIEAIFELIVPLVMAQIIDVGIPRGDRRYVLLMIGLMVLLGIVGLGCALTCQYFASRASQGFGTVVRNALFRHINGFSHAEIDRFGTPSLITRLNNDVNQLQLAVAMCIRLATRAPFLIIGAAVMAVLIDWRMSLIFFVAMILIALTLYLIMTRSVPFYRTIQRFLDRISRVTRENLSGVRVIRAFSRQTAEKSRFADTSDELMRASVRVGKLSALLNPLTYLLVNGAILLILWFGGLRVNTGGLLQGEVIALVNYMTTIMLALIVLANLVVIFTKAAASATRVSEVLQTEPSIRDDPQAGVSQPEVQHSNDSITPKVAFCNVSFSYTGSDEYCLSDINLYINPGETVGVIGGTGAGKSTLVSLIPRFYDPVKGEVLIDGQPVKQWPLKTLRKRIGIVPQTAVLFSGTLRENLLWGDEKATDEQLAAALEIAQAAAFVDELPDGYDTRIEQGGKNLSGGQRQRLTIARALVRRPDILILDDSASALDFATDLQLRRALRQGTDGMTVFLVSQRANTVKSADRIVVLDDGMLAGVGTHTELLNTCEAYREICLSQLSQDELDREGVQR